MYRSIIKITAKYEVFLDNGGIINLLFENTV
jgi:hypothetical protein